MKSIDWKLLGAHVPQAASRDDMGSSAFGDRAWGGEVCSGAPRRRNHLKILLNVQIPGPHLRAIESELLGVGCTIRNFGKRKKWKRG